MKWSDLFRTKRLFSEPRFTVLNGKLVPIGDNLESNIKEAYEAISTIYAMVKIMTDKASTIPWTLKKVSTAQKAQLREIRTWSPSTMLQKKLMEAKLTEIDDHPFLKLMRKPNGWQSRGEFIKQFLGYRYITGNSYLRKNCGQMPGIDPGKALPVELQILPSQYMSIKSGDGMWDITAYQLKNDVLFHPKEIMHFKYPNYRFDPVTKDHLYGMSPLKSATMDITAAKYLKRAQAAQAQNEGAKGLLVRNDDFEMLEEQRDHIQDRVDSEVNNYEQRGRAVVTNANLRWEQIGLSAADLRLVETFQIGKNDLANIYNMPPHLLSSVNTNFASVDAAIKYLTTNTIMPDLMDLRDMLNELIEAHWGPGLWYDFDVSDLPELADEQNKLAQSMKDWYWITPNEKRFLTKWAQMDDPDMDKIIVPSGYVPLERVFEDPFMNNVNNDYTNGEDTSDDKPNGNNRTARPAQ